MTRRGSSTPGPARTRSSSSTRPCRTRRPGRCAGSTRAPRRSPPRQLRSSTHAFGVADAIELARALGSLPARLRVCAIEGADFSLGVPMTAAVEAAVEALAAELRAAGAGR